MADDVDIDQFPTATEGMTAPQVTMSHCAKRNTIYQSRDGTWVYGDWSANMSIACAGAGVNGQILKAAIQQSTVIGKCPDGIEVIQVIHV